MPEYLAPGVYIEEIERGPRPIEGVPTSTAAFLGETERGPARPRLVTSYAEYVRVFGGVFGNGKHMPHAVRAFFDNGGKRVYVARIAGPRATVASATLGGVKVSAIGPGEAGNRIWVRLGASKAGFRLQVFYWDAPAAPFDPIKNTARKPRPTMSEDFDGLSLDSKSPNHFEKRVNENSLLVRVSVAPGARLSRDQSAALSGGRDGGTATAAHYLGASKIASKRIGLSALELDTYREVAIVHAPAASKDVARLVVEHCERGRFRFAVIDCAENAAVVSLDPRSDTDTSYAAFYAPWLFINDPAGARVKIPPGGATCGIYARTDETRGVFKAPANEVVNGALDVELRIDNQTNEILNPRGVNAIRPFPARGIRVWGARTLSTNALWKYVSVRRLFIFLERSIHEGMQWVVFEPNDERLWARVKDTITVFLRGQWRAGALLGIKEEQAFFVAVGRETMTQDDILNGRLIVEVGVVPVQPAEFVIFRIFQNTAEAKS